MLVSHDRALLRSVCDEFWLVSRGGVEPFDGDLDDYQHYLLEEARRAREDLKAALKSPKPAATPAPAPAPATPRINPEKLKGLKRDLGKLEQTILDVQTRKHALEAQLSGHPAADKIAELGRELAQVDASLNTHEEQWLLLSEEIEAAGG